MQQILAIFRKDARHLWPQISVFAALMILAAVLDPTYSGHPSAIYDFLPSFALPLACWLVIISGVHEERLPGDRQYWLTRPCSWKTLLAAKALFVAAFVNLPLLLYHACVFVAVGIPPADHLGVLLWRQLFFTIFYILPAAALAAITRNLGQVAVTALSAVVFVWVSGTLFLFLARYRIRMYQGLDGGMIGVTAALIAVGAMAILVVQYSRRRTLVARLLTAGVTATVLVFTTASPYIFGRTPSVSTSSLSLDSDPTRKSSMVTSGRPEIATLDLPVRLEGIPSGTLLEQKRVDVRVGVSGNPDLYTKGDGGLHDFAGERAWLSVRVDRKGIEDAQSKAITVTGMVTFQRNGATQTLALPKGRPVVLPGIGVCRDLLEPEGTISFSCYTPSPRKALLIGNSGIRVNWIIPQGSVEGPVPTAGGFEPLMKFVSQVSYRNWEQIGNARMLVVQPLPPVRIAFELGNLTYSEYLVGRPHK